MTCSDVNEQLLDYLYGELDPDAARAVEEHAQGCDACAAELKGLSVTLVSTRSALQGPLDQRPPARVSARVRRHAARRAGEAWPVALLRACLHWLRRPLLLPVLCAASIAVLGITLRIRSRPDLSERYALAPPASSPPPRSASPEVSATSPATVAQRTEPTASGSPAIPAIAADGQPAGAAPSANAGEALAMREYAAPPTRGAAPADVPAEPAPPAALKRGDAVSASRAPRVASPTAARGRAMAARKSARRARAGATLAESPLVAEAEPFASAASTSDLRAELGVAPEPSGVEAETAPAADAAAERPASPATPAPALRPLLQRADRAFRNKRWGTAAAAYQQLLRSYPSHRSATIWKRRLSVAETALEGR